MANGNRLPLREILGIPLADLVDAERAAAHATVAFLRDVGFTGSRDDEDWGELRHVSFRYRAPETDNAVSERSVQVPLLSLLPLPLVQLAKAEFEYSVLIEGKEDVPGQSAPYAGDTRKRARSDFVGRIESAESQRGPLMRVKMEISAADLPGGLAFLLRKLDQSTLESVQEEK